MREAWGVALRDLKKRYYVWKDVAAVLITAVVIVAFGAGVELFLISDEEAGYTLFFASGMIGMLVVFGVMSTGHELVVDRKGFNKILLAAPIRNEAILLGKTIFAFINSIKTFFVASILLMIYFNTFSVVNALLLIPVLVLISLSFTGMAYFTASFFRNRDHADNFIQYISMPLLFLSGAFYSLKEAPEFVHFLYYANPATYAVEGTRNLISGEGELSLVLVLVVLAFLGIAFSLAGISVYNRMIRKG